MLDRHVGHVSWSKLQDETSTLASTSTVPSPNGECVCWWWPQANKIKL